VSVSTRSGQRFDAGLSRTPANSCGFPTRTSSFLLETGVHCRLVKLNDIFSMVKRRSQLIKPNIPKYKPRAMKRSPVDVQS